MNLSFLQTFVSVAELRHFARAAAACNLSQPAVSHQIAQLEEELGARLLNRTGRRISLTVAGEVMQEEAQRILAAVDRARERMHEVTTGAVGRIRLGASATPGLYLLPPLLAKYKTEHPRFDLAFHVGPADDVAERVVRNDLDMAVIAGRPPTTELRMRRLLRDELVVIAAPEVFRSRPRGASLDQACWILREERSSSRRAVDAWLTKRGITPKQTMTFDGPDAVKRAVMAGLGVAVVSGVTVQAELTAGTLVPVRVAGVLPAHDIFLVDHPQKHHGAACRAMLRLLSETFDDQRQPQTQSGTAAPRRTP